MKTKATKKRGVRETPWAKAIRTAREKEGYSQRELARRIGVAQETVRATELGRPPRHSTLVACLSALPSLRPTDLLPGRAVAPAATPAAWRTMRSIFGFSAQKLQIDRVAGQDGPDRLKVSVTGMRANDAVDMESPATQLALMRAACVGSSKLMRRLTVPKLSQGRGEAAHDEPDGKHVFRFRRKAGTMELDYSFTGTAEPNAPFEHALDVVVAEMVMTLREPPSRTRKGKALRPVVRPETVPVEEADPDLCRRMYPILRFTNPRGGEANWVLRNPLPGFAYSLRHGTQDAPVSARSWSLASTLKIAREKEGLGMRAVAEIAGRSHASLSYAEAGRDPRASTLAGYLKALPSVAPQDLLPYSAKTGELSDEDAWLLMRDLYGIEIDRIEKTVTVGPDGVSTTVIDTQGLRPLRGSLKDFRVRNGLHRAVAQVNPSILQSIETERAGSKLRLLKRQEGPVVHEFMFPRSLEGASISYRRTYTGPKFPLSRAQAGVPLCADEPLLAGAVVPIYNPVKSITLNIVLPSSLSPEHVRTVAYPACFMADTVMPELSERLVAPPCSMVLKGNELRMSLTVKLPLVGLRYGIAWGIR